MVAFPALWLVGTAAAQIHLLAVQRPWSGIAWIVILTVPAAFLGGAAGVRLIVSARVPRAATPPGLARPSRRVLVGLLLLGYAELAREFAAGGAVPLLSSNIDAARTHISSGPLSLLTGALVVCLMLALVSPPRLAGRSARPELVVAAAAAAGLMLGGGRETVLVPLTSAFVVRAFYWRPPAVWTVLVGGLLGVELASLVFYLRTGQDTRQAFAVELYGHVVPRTPAPLVVLLPLHFALALNQSVLAQVVDFFPHRMSFGHGIYDTYALHAIFPSRSLGTVTSKITAPWLASTLAGPMWADGGLPIVALGSFLTGALTQAPYAMFSRTRRFPHALLAGYFAAIAMFCVYDSLLTQYKDWVFVGAALLLLGAACERPARMSRRGQAGAGPRDPPLVSEAQ